MYIDASRILYVASCFECIAPRLDLLAYHRTSELPFHMANLLAIKIQVVLKKQATTP